MRVVLLCSVALLWPLLAAADSVIIPETAGDTPAGDWTVRGFTSQTNQAADYILWGKDSGAFSSDLPDKTDGVPQPPNVGGEVYPNASFPKSQGSTTLGALRSVFTSEFGLPGAFLDDFAIYVTLNELTGGGELPVEVPSLQFQIRRGASVLTSWDLNVDGVHLLNDVQTGQSLSDYRFMVTGGMGLAQYLDTDELHVDLNMRLLSNGQEIWWADEPFTFTQETDFGDLPELSAQYATTLANDGARHLDGTQEWLGATRDGEADGQPSRSAIDDDFHGIDDEDGVVFDPATGMFVVTLSVADQTDTARYGSDPSQQVYLTGFIDLNNDGDFDDPGERVSTAEDPTDGTWSGNQKTVQFPINVTPGTIPIYSRWRFSYGVEITTTTGLADYGEVEDYLTVPEPTTLALLALGGLGLLRRRRRRRRA